MRVSSALRGRIALGVGGLHAFHSFPPDHFQHQCGTDLFYFAIKQVLRSVADLLPDPLAVVLYPVFALHMSEIFFGDIAGNFPRRPARHILIAAQPGKAVLDVEIAEPV